MTLELCELTIDDLKVMRKYLLYLYATGGANDPKHHEIGMQLDRICYELVRRTGDSKWKS
jgi:hypothetical protein